MSIIAKIVEEKTEIWVVNYLRSGEEEMIAIASELQKRILTKGKRVMILALVNDSNTIFIR
jgi:hypothetical protein